MNNSPKSNFLNMYIIGEGGSAAVAKHTAIDLTENTGVRALTASGSLMLVTFSNDYGYRDAFEKFV